MVRQDKSKDRSSGSMFGAGPQDSWGQGFKTGNQKRKEAYPIFD